MGFHCLAFKNSPLTRKSVEVCDCLRQHSALAYLISPISL